VSCQERFRLVAVGDIMLSGGYWEVASKAESLGVFEELKPLLAEADIAVGNLEGPLTECSVAAPPWCFCLHGHPFYARVLRSAGFGVLDLANNHIMDCGWEGVEETLDVLSKAGIRAFGAGVNLAAARTPLRLSVGGVNVAFLGYCDVPVNRPYYATATRPGVAPAEVVPMIEDVHSARRESDLVVVCLHWGQEMVSCPSPRQRRVARQLVAAGAGMILGHHPHVLQGIEQVSGGLVAYSLGTYSVCEEEWIGKKSNGELFRQMHMGPSDGWRRQAVLRVGVAHNGTVLRHCLIPTYIRTDMFVVKDTRPERVGEFEQNDEVLGRPFYSLRWGAQHLRARISDHAGHIAAGSPSWKIALRLRPRHLTRLRNTLVNEWQQWRGLQRRRP
jgi:Bacterial capsule synthesis protein PGA_cap